MEKTDIPNEIQTKKVKERDDNFIACGAEVRGDVRLGKESSIWYNAVLRGDINRIEIGDRTNIQDGSVLHVENDRACIVGSDVTVGHSALLHGCTIEEGALIGMGAIILNGALIKKGAVIAAGALIKENEVVEENTLWAGVPAKQIKVLEGSYEKNKLWAKKYIELSKAHKKERATN